MIDAIVNTAWNVRPLRGILLLILVGSLLGSPAIAIGHGWKAPPEAVIKSNPVAADEASFQRGQILYRQYCVVCHGEGGAGDGPAAAALPTQPADLLKRAGSHSDGDVFWKIETGRGSMPGFKEQLGENQIWDLVNYIQNLSRKR